MFSILTGLILIPPAIILIRLGFQTSLTIRTVLLMKLQLTTMAMFNLTDLSNPTPWGVWMLQYVFSILTRLILIPVTMILIRLGFHTSLTIRTVLLMKLQLTTMTMIKHCRI